MTEKRYTKTHEWVQIEDGGNAVIGITAHAAEELGDLVFVEGKPNGTKMAVGDTVAIVESVKAASDIYAPLAGEVIAFNTALNEKPDLVNRDPQGAGWIVKMKLASPEEFNSLLSAQDYKAL